ncbi:hypothetical protein ABW19_dt0201530 [Dactylella cylindrospora]|nr:hypothetical protein ABW19_dt0201530 [Dactylella cylindrospora]
MSSSKQSPGRRSVHWDLPPSPTPSTNSSSGFPSAGAYEEYIEYDEEDSEDSIFIIGMPLPTRFVAQPPMNDRVSEAHILLWNDQTDEAYSDFNETFLDALAFDDADEAFFTLDNCDGHLVNRMDRVAGVHQELDYHARSTTMFHTFSKAYIRFYMNRKHYNSDFTDSEFSFQKPGIPPEAYFRDRRRRTWSSDFGSTLGGETTIEPVFRRQKRKYDLEVSK